MNIFHNPSFHPALKHPSWAMVRSTPAAIVLSGRAASFLIAYTTSAFFARSELPLPLPRKLDFLKGFLLFSGSGVELEWKLVKVWAIVSVASWGKGVYFLVAARGGNTEKDKHRRPHQLAP